MKHSFFRIKPKNFQPTLQVCSCYIECNGKLLFLKRAAEKPEGNQWGVPAGKIEKFENVEHAVCREVFEETGLRINKKELHFIGNFFVRKLNIDYVYHMFHYNLTQLPSISLNDEHQEYRWLNFQECFQIPLMSGAEEALHHFKAISNKPKLLRNDFFYIRHGETDVNTDKNIKRVDYDLPLNAIGRDQALSVRSKIVNLPVQSVCCSPIQRAVETKDILIKGLNKKCVEINGLRECKAAVWTKMIKLEEGQGYHVCDDILNYFVRVLNGVRMAQEQGSPTLIISHGGVYWALCYQMAIENLSWRIGNCQLVHFKPVGDVGWEAQQFPE